MHNLADPDQAEGQQTALRGQDQALGRNWRRRQRFCRARLNAAAINAKEGGSPIQVEAVDATHAVAVPVEGHHMGGTNPNMRVQIASAVVVDNHHSQSGSHTKLPSPSKIQRPHAHPTSGFTSAVFGGEGDAFTFSHEPIRMMGLQLLEPADVRCPTHARIKLPNTR